MKHKKLIQAILVVGLLFIAIPAFAENPDISTGLAQVDAKTLADKVITIALGVGALSGAAAAFILIFLGFKLKAANERTRAETKTQIMYVFAGLGLVGLAIVIVGFAAFLIKGA